MTFDLSTLWHLAVAVLGGLAVGIERQWSGHAAGPGTRFAGVRTFSLIGLVAGLGGAFWAAGLAVPSGVLLGGLAALIVVAYAGSTRRNLEATTEVAAFVVLAAGVLAGAGALRLASGIIAVTVLLLVEKKPIHGLVAKLDQVEIKAGARFAVMAAIVLPILPEGPFGPFGGIRPRQLWALVLFFSGLSFLGYIAQRVARKDQGYAIAGTLGGLLSSTSVTLTLSQLSREKPEVGRALAAGTLGANVMLFPRVLLASSVLAPALAWAIWPAFVAPVLIGTALVFRGLRQAEASGPLEPDANPLRVGAALKLAGFFQVVLFGMFLATEAFGREGLYGSAVVLGLADVDALTLSVSRLTTEGTAAAVAATALTIGVLTNTIVKLGITLALGRGRYRPLAAAGLAAMAVALTAALVWLI